MPIFAVIYAGVKTFINRKLKKKNLPVDTAKYMNVGQIGEEDEFTEYIPPEKKHGKKTHQKKEAPPTETVVGEERTVLTDPDGETVEIVEEFVEKKE